MPVLKNPKHEKFAQALAEGASQYAAHGLAGYNPHRGNAFKLAHNADIIARVAELQQRISTIRHEANLQADEIITQRYAISKEKILDELARIAFANILDYIRIGNDGMPYVDFSAVDRDKGIAIQEVSCEVSTVMEVDEHGERVPVQVRKAKFKLYDKQRALIDLGKHLGMFREQVVVEHRGEQSVEELRAEVKAMIAELGVDAQLILPPPSGIANRRQNDGE